MAPRVTTILEVLGDMMIYKQKGKALLETICVAVVWYVVKDSSKDDDDSDTMVHGTAHNKDETVLSTRVRCREGGEKDESETCVSGTRR